MGECSTVAPTLRVDERGGKDIFDHDAFGQVVMTTVNGGNGAFFGSDIRHGQKIRISVHRAELTRDLSKDWIHGENLPILEFDMSHSQLAQFITSTGNGNGTPVTLVYAPPRGAISETMPGIKPIESSTDTFRRELKDSVTKQISTVMKDLKRMGALIESGKISKTELKEIHHSMTAHMGNLPENMEFVVSQAEDHLEHATTEAKIDIETFAAHTAQRIGYEQAHQLGLVWKSGEVKSPLLENSKATAQGGGT